MSTDVSTVVSIANGIGTGTGRQLDDNRWGWFKREVRAVVVESCGPLVCEGEGMWWYNRHPNAVDREVNYVVVAGEFPKDRAEFESTIAALAKLYEQDSIAVTYGVPAFIEPPK